MWTYTAYILYKYCRDIKNTQCEVLTFKELTELFFDKLWQKRGIVLHDSKQDLYADLQYLEQLGVIEINGDVKNIDTIIIKVKDVEKLKQIADIVEKTYTVTGIGLFNVYKSRIDEALKALKS